MLKHVTIDPDAAKKQFEADLAKMRTPGAPPPPSDKPKQIRQPRFSKAEQVRNVWQVTLPADWDYAEVLKPNFFKLCNNHLRLGDLIEVRNDQLTIWARLLVVVADFVNAHFEVRELEFKELAPASTEAASQKGFRIAFEGVTDQWCIYREADNKKMLDKLPSPQEAAHRIQTDLSPRALGAM